MIGYLRNGTTPWSDVLWIDMMWFVLFYVLMMKYLVDDNMR